MNKLHSKEISRGTWRFLIISLWIFGGLTFSIFNSTFFIPLEHIRVAGFAAIGLLLVGIGFGLAYARVFKIRGVDLC